MVLKDFLLNTNVIKIGYLGLNSILNIILKYGPVIFIMSLDERNWGKAACRGEEVIIYAIGIISFQIILGLHRFILKSRCCVF